MIKQKRPAYLKVVEWSDEDQCYIGTAPGLFLGGVHGKDESKVFRELCAVAAEMEAILLKDGRPIPPQIMSRKFSGKIPLRISPDLHKTITIKALRNGDSLNKYIEEILSAQ
ncbi:MAG: toxin-antitoxin system HicB family antitoxin [Candidatus Omnitrophica bacterium]|nr:toxin-antitoxin system HicB family antitoxin [Candidatus Omnitrophota bacterium]